MTSKYFPDNEHRYFLYDPEGEGLTFYTSADERDEAAKDAITYYLDGHGWAEEVDGVIGGEVTHQATQCDVLQRPATLDEDDCDDNGMYWSPEVDCMFNYKLAPLAHDAEDHSPRATQPSTTPR